MTWVSIVDILVAAALIYNVLGIFSGRRAVHVAIGMALLAGVYLLALFSGWTLVNRMLTSAAPYAPIAFIVMFQADIRRFLARLGRGRWIGLGRQLERREVEEEVLLAAQELAQSKTGALIVLEGEVSLRTYIESGVAMEAKVSRDLLNSIFIAKGPMHDGAVIVQRERIMAAACFLPLSTSANVQGKLGTRHRAAIGVTEESDALAIAVSEETGMISTAVRGELERNVGIEGLQERLRRHGGVRVRHKTRALQALWFLISLTLAILLWLYLGRA